MEARTRAEVQRIEFLSKAEGKRSEAEGDAHARRLKDESEAKAVQLRAEAEVRAYQEREKVGDRHKHHSNGLKSRPKLTAKRRPAERVFRRAASASVLCAS